MLEVTPEITIPTDQLSFTFVRSGGPGGQNVNKVSSKAVLRWNIRTSGLFSDEILERFLRFYPSYCTDSGDVILTCQESRDAPKNKLLCLQKLRAMLLNALRVPKKRIPTRPTRASIRRRLENKARQSQKKQDRKNNFVD